MQISIESVCCVKGGTEDNPGCSVTAAAAAAAAGDDDEDEDDLWLYSVNHNLVMFCFVSAQAD